MAELDRRGDAERREAGEILRCQQLRVLDAVAETERLPYRGGLLEGVECLPVGEIADRVDRDREPCLRSLADDLRESFPARDLDAGAVEHPRRL